jgi:hypothetical protein
LGEPSFDPRSMMAMLPGAYSSEILQKFLPALS